MKSWLGAFLLSMGVVGAGSVVIGFGVLLILLATYNIWYFSGAFIILLVGLLTFGFKMADPL